MALQKFFAIFDRFLYLHNLWVETSAAHPLVNSQTCHASTRQYGILSSVCTFRALLLKFWKKAQKFCAIS